MQVANGKREAGVCQSGNDGVFERQCLLLLTWPWGPIMGLLGLCGGGCAWGDC